MMEGVSGFFGFEKPDFEIFDYKPSKYDYNDDQSQDGPGFNDPYSTPEPTPVDEE